MILCFLIFGTLLADQKPICATIPKSGTHLLKKAIEMMTDRPIRWIPLSETDAFNPNKDLRITDSMTSVHLFPEIDIVRTSFGNSYTKILLIRDPRDIMASFAHHLLRKMVWFSCPQFDHDAFEKRSFDERLTETLLLPAVYRSPAVCFETAALWVQDPTVFVCRFEDLVGEQGGGSKERQQQTLKKLAEQLKIDLSSEKVEWITNNLFGGTWTFREGKIGGWEKLYNEKNKQLFKDLMGRSVIELGYETDNNW